MHYHIMFSYMEGLTGSEDILWTTPSRTHSWTHTGDSSTPPPKKNTSLWGEGGGIITVHHSVTDPLDHRCSQRGNYNNHKPRDWNLRAHMERVTFKASFIILKLPGMRRKETNQQLIDTQLKWAEPHSKANQPHTITDVEALALGNHITGSNTTAARQSVHLRKGHCSFRNHLKHFLQLPVCRLCIAKKTKLSCKHCSIL